MRQPFSYIAIFLGIPLLILLFKSAPEITGGEPKIPLLTMLIVSEFGFVVTAIGVFTSVQTQIKSGIKNNLIASALCCAALSIKFMLIGVSYWPL